jgi:hypothetical protein
LKTRSLLFNVERYKFLTGKVPEAGLGALKAQMIPQFKTIRHFNQRHTAGVTLVEERAYLSERPLIRYPTRIQHAA